MSFLFISTFRQYTPNALLFEELVEKVQLLKSFRASLGGNAAMIGRRFALSGFDVLLATSASRDFKKLLPDSMRSKILLISWWSELSNFLIILIHFRISVAGEVTEKDDIHLIFEYKAGDKCGPYVAPRANR